MVEEADRNITWYRFREIVAHLRRRKVLQGGTTLYITPKALHLKLWRDWWETYGTGFVVDEFYRSLTEMLRAWFGEMFQYAALSPVTTRVARDLLGEQGPFRDHEMLRSELGADLFLALTEAEPRCALRTLERTIGTWSAEQLLEFTTGRRQIVWSLEKIAVWRDLFPGAARLLLALGEAENERFSNNASGVFAGLFSPGWGEVAPTEASPDERFPILIEALRSDSKERRLLALDACAQALESQRFSRIGQEGHQGLRPSAQLWMPETYGELFTAYRHVWQLVSNQLERLPEDEQLRAADIILKRARDLGAVPNLSGMVVDTLSELVQRPYVDEKKVLEKVIEVLHYEGSKLSSKMRERWEHLRERLTGEGFSAMMKRYVGMDLLVDKFNRSRNRVDRARPAIKQLAQQAVEEPNILELELRWLVTPEARNGFTFGYELGQRDSGLTLMPALLEAQKAAGDTATDYFLGGYFRALFEVDPSKWEEQLDALTKDIQLREWVPALTWRSGMTDRAALRVLSLYEKGLVDVQSSRLFTLGGVAKHLSEYVVVRFIEFLLENPTNTAASVALDLIHFYYLDEESDRTLPRDLSLRALTHHAFLRSSPGQQDQMDEYSWTEVATAFVQNNPEESIDLAEFMLAHFNEDGTVFQGYFSRTQNVLTEIVKAYPEQIWTHIAKYLGPPIDSRAFSIRQWLKGRDPFEPGAGAVLDLIPPVSIWRWVDEDIEQRGWYIANLVPPILFREKSRTCLAREVLVRYGDREDVQQNLMANFSTEGWTGPRSLHLKQKRDELLKFKQEEHNHNVRWWLDEYILTLNESIESARIQEERRGY